MTPSLEGWSIKAKEAPSPHEVRLAPLYINPVFQWEKMVFSYNGGIGTNHVMLHLTIRYPGLPPWIILSKFPLEIIKDFVLHLSRDL